MSAVPYPALRLGAAGRVTAANALARAVFHDDPVGRPVSSLFAANVALPDSPAALAERLGEGRSLTLLDAEGQVRFLGRAEAWDGGGLLVLVSLSVEGPRQIDVDLLALAVDAANNSIVIADLTQDDEPLVYANEWFLEFTGYAAEEVIGRNCRFLQFRDGERDDDGEGQREALDALRAGISATEHVGGVVLRNYKKSGERFYNELYLTPITDESGRTTHMIGVQNDVTQRVLAQREREREFDRLRGIFAASAVPLGLLERGADGSLVHVLRNVAADELGLDGAEGGGLDALGPGSDALWRSAADTAGVTGQPARFDVTRAGRTFEVLLSPVESEGRRARDGRVGGGGPARFLYVAADVTDGRVATEELLHVSNRQLTRIARDIHDGVGQSLVGASMMAAALARDLVGGPHEADAARLQALLLRSLTQLRSFALGLDPVDLDRLGAGEALARLAADARAALGVEVEVDDRLGGADLREDVLLDLYRVAQEALTNAVRHGQARSVRLVLHRAEADRLVLDVDDDGRGLPEDAADGGGMGLRTMRARARRHGGALSVEPRGGGGTRVRLTLPAAGAAAGQVAGDG